MVEGLIAVVIVSAIAAGLAALIVVAQALLANYGPCEITINDRETLTVEGGQSLLEGLTANSVFIPSACGGRGTCGYCKLKVHEGGGPLLPTEEPYLDDAERAENVRLSCQVKVREALSIEIPEELFAVKQFTCRCERIRELTHDIREIRLQLVDPAEIDYTPGQYVQLFAPSYDDNEEVYRAYSIASDPAETGIIELVIRLVPGGICTTWVFEHLEEGEEATFNGPYGEFQLTETDAPMIFVAGGSGMAPIRCVLHQMKNEGIDREATYFFGANKVGELFYRDEMRAFEEALPRFRFVPVVASPGEDEDWDGETGLVTDALAKAFESAAEHEAYLCGSPGMIDATVKVLGGLGMPEEHIFYDKFS